MTLTLGALGIKSLGPSKRPDGALFGRESRLIIARPGNGGSAFKQQREPGEAFSLPAPRVDAFPPPAAGSEGQPWPQWPPAGTYKPTCIDPGGQQGLLSYNNLKLRSRGVLEKGPAQSPLHGGPVDGREAVPAHQIGPLNNSRAAATGHLLSVFSSQEEIRRSLWKEL